MTIGFDDIRQRLFTAVIGDVLDAIGRYHQFLPAGIRAVGGEGVLVGRAMPVLIVDEFAPPARAFGRLTEALDSLQSDEIYLARSGTVECAAWGEILTTTAKARGAAGAVIDGYHRDTRQLLASRWPVFSRGAYGQDAGVRASVRDFRVPVEVGQVRIHPGDLIVGDLDGVIIVPTEVEDEVLERSVEKVRAEQVTLSAITGGMLSSEAWDTFGVL